MRELKKRLYTVSTLVPKGARVADIGTDHGHLPIYLRQNGISPFCIASDIKEKPLATARLNIQKTSTSEIDTRLGFGLSTVKPYEVDCITIAGMGGEVISSIIAEAQWLKDSRYTLILQPMTSADALRKYLCENGFAIIREVATDEADRVYTVLKVQYSGICFSPDDAFLRCGKLSAKDPISRRYIEKQLKIVKKCIDDLTASGKDAALNDLYNTYNSIKNLLGD